MRIVHHSNQLGIGGTEKCMQYFLEYLKGSGYDCYCMHKRQLTDLAGGYRESMLKELLGEEKVMAYSSAEEFFSFAAVVRPEIFHVHRSGRGPEFPVVPRLKEYCSKVVETNVFGGFDPSGVVDLTLFVNGYLARGGRAGPSAVLFNPVKRPRHGRDLRGKLGISGKTVVLGRIGRPDDRIFDPISLRAFSILEREAGVDVLYLVQSPPPAMVRAAAELGLRKVRFLAGPVISDDEVTEFYNTIDILAHSRLDGETFGLTIAEAMMHGKPVVSHRSLVANGHKAFVEECGFFVAAGDHRAYAHRALELCRDAGLRRRLGEKGRRFAEENFLFEKVVAQLERYYEGLMETRTRLQPSPRDSAKKTMHDFYSSSNSYKESLKGNDRSGYPEMLQACSSNFGPGARVLDCGCGLGSFTRLLAGAGFDATGVDVSPLFIAEARRRHAGRENMRFLVEDASCMSFPDRCFDGVSSTLFLEHSADVEGTLTEMARVLRPGGVLIVNLPSFLDPVQHLSDLVHWKKRSAYRPWEARSRIGAMFRFVRISAIMALKWLKLNRKIYYLTPVLSENEAACGHDFDATWLANRFDVERILEDLGLDATTVFPGTGMEGPVASVMRKLGLPGRLVRAYGDMRASGIIIIARKKGHD